MMGEWFAFYARQAWILCSIGKISIIRFLMAKQKGIRAGQIKCYRFYIASLF